MYAGGDVRKREAQILTELEGAVLSVINGLGSCTPYQVRQNFLASRSREWSGSAGAVYPAVRRLHSAGLLRAQQTEDARGSVRFSLSARGRKAFDAWLKDVERACGSGLDPFRCRADLWYILPAIDRRALLQTLMQKLEQRIGMLDALFDRTDTIERRALVLEIELHKTRLRWLERELAAGT
jgi:DNA-binding PadR family transcriptional regulator